MSHEGEPAPRCLNVKEAAHYLGCTIWHLRSLVWEHKLAAIKMGARLLFPRDALDAYVDSLLKEARA